MNEDEEAAYERGFNAAWRSIAKSAVHVIDPKYETDLARRVALANEADEARASLRCLCSRFGLSNTWSDTLHLADIIEKHVERSLADLLEEAKE
jgi:hypothetical protein